ncbi:hypothetical protein [Paenibacillus cremeus]|uniref:Uncharacterized protein n=1 Tax=Paenibacillus cremeus TaxID=2163881 RepID=A0A559K8J2_9BACL|nr:hypothetical protein [Paenibacillus cremeus]TVY08438.1 hypothetical protein FPZ49_18555 [Paenibacillus cremeus]
MELIVGMERERESLMMTWGEQLWVEAREAVRQAVTEEELARAVWALAKLAYGRAQGKGLEELLAQEAGEVVQQLPQQLTLPEALAQVLRALSRMEEEAAWYSSMKRLPKAAEMRTLAERLSPTRTPIRPVHSWLQ